MEESALLLEGRRGVLNHILQLRQRIAQHTEFRCQFTRFKTLAHSQRFPLNWKDRYPCMEERTLTTSFDRHYIYHTAWAARVLARTRPSEHVDISSSLYFAAIASAFIPIRHYDFRPPQLRLSNLSVEHADLSALPFQDGAVRSLSCMHVVEHIGLGRYGDRLDPEGDLKAVSELKRVTAVGGDLLFVVPVGRPRLRFNAHRIYSYDQVIDCFADMETIGFALIPDDPKQGGLMERATGKTADAQSYGCGCFWFRKKV
jgi:hypothetical protein